MKWFFIAGIRLYQRLISPRLSPRCRFTPGCSSYSAEAFSRYGAFLGLGLCVWRLLRYNPFGKGGHDPLV